MTLDDLQKSYIECACGLGDYQSISKLDLANGYCDADEQNDEVKRSQYWSALMLRYWYKIYGWMKDSASCKLQPENFVDWLNDALYIAFYYRAWRWEYEAVVKFGKFIEWKKDENGNLIPNEHYWKKDPAAADRSIHYFCTTWRGREYQALNKDLRKSNVLSDSLDEALDNLGDCVLEKAGATSSNTEIDNVKELVRIFLKQDRTLEALIIDGIAYHSAFKTVKHEMPKNEYIDEEELPFKVEKYSYEHVFNQRMLVKHLSEIDHDFMENYFKPFYEIDDEECELIYDRLKKANNNKLYRYIKKTLINLKSDPELLSYILTD